MGRIGRSIPALVAFLLAASSLQAAFQTENPGVRSLSLGRSMMGSLQGASCLFSNPAGLPFLSAPEFAFAYGRPFLGLPNSVFHIGHTAFAFPAAIGSFGAGAGVMRASNLIQEETWVLGYGRSLSPWLEIGVAGKLLIHSYLIHGNAAAQADPVYRQGASRSALAWDGGMLVRLGPSFQAAGVVRNINRPDVGLMSDDKVPRESRVGMELNAAGLKMNSDVTFPNGGWAERSAFFRVGIEKILYRSMALRLGANSQEFTGGLGMRIGRMGVDYGFVWSRHLADNLGSHYMGMTFQFPGRKKA